MNDCKACGGFFSCGGDTSECLHPEGAEAVAAAQVQSPSQLPAAQAVAGGVPTLDIPSLIDLAFQARCDDLRMSKYRRDGQTGREFIILLVEHVEKVAGTTVADSLASALAFDYLRADVL